MRKTDYPMVEEELYTAILPNGLPVYVVRKPGFAEKYAYLAVNYGSMDMTFDLNGRKRTTPAGVAHYLEHKMFDLPDLDVMQVYSGLGASPNAFTTYDMTAYYFRCTERFDRCLELLLRFVSTPYFTEESVERERGIIAQEIRMGEDSPDARVYEELLRAMYRTHPVRVPIAGDLESIRDITPELLYDCHRAFYHPGNMVLSVVGDVDPERVAEIAARMLPDTGPPPELRRDLGPREDLICPRSKTVLEMDVAMPTFQLGFKCPDPGVGPGSLRAQYLGDLAAETLMGESSTLYLRLYEKGLIDGSFGVGYEMFPGTAVFSCGGDSEAPEVVRDAVLEEWQRLSREGLDEGLFRRLKKSELGRRIRDLDGFDSLCYRICAGHFAGAAYLDFPAAYNAVTREEVEAFLRQTVVPEHMSLSVVLPRDRKER